jgi:hypothetical protein
MTTEERLTKLERSLRRWKLGAILGVGLVAGMGAMQDRTRLRCLSLSVVDEATGDTRISLGTTEDGRPSLMLFAPGSRLGRDRPGDYPKVSLVTMPKRGGMVVIRDASGENSKFYELGD